MCVFTHQENYLRNKDILAAGGNVFTAHSHCGSYNKPAYKHLTILDGLRARQMVRSQRLCAPASRPPAADGFRNWLVHLRSCAIDLTCAKFLVRAFRLLSFAQ
jgi:hypothetical protein